MLRRLSFFLILLVGTTVSAHGQDSPLGNQWEPTDLNLHGLLSEGWSVASIEQQVVPMLGQGIDRIAILTSYFLTQGEGLMRCDEVHFRPPYDERSGLAPPLGAPNLAPSSSISCSRLTAPR